VITLISSSPLPFKLSSIFALFDFGENQALTLDELVILCHAVCTGLAKIESRMDIPSVSRIEQLVRRSFSRVGKTVDDEVSFEDFEQFCRINEAAAHLIEYAHGAATLGQLPLGREKWTDPEFCDIDQVLHGGAQPPVFGGAAEFHWRPAPARTILVLPDDLVPTRVCHGYLTSRAVAAALNTLAARPRCIQQLFVTTGQEDRGRITFQFFYDGCWKVVSVDDRVLCTLGFVCSSCGTYPVHFCGFAHSQDDPWELWPALIEKGMAKLVGSYAALARLSVCDILEMLTAGCACITTLNTDPDRSRAFRDLHHLFNLGVLGVLVRAKATAAECRRRGSIAARKGFAQDTVYPVHGVKQGLVRLRIPADKKRHRYVGAEADEDGLVWVPFEDFCFDDAVLCRVFDRAHWGLSFNLKSSMVASGDLSGQSWYKSDQMCLSVYSNSTPISVSVFSRGIETHGAIGLAIVSHDFGDPVDDRAKPVAILAQGQVKGVSIFDDNKRSADCHVVLGPGKYVIVILGRRVGEFLHYSILVRVSQAPRDEPRASLWGGEDVDWADAAQAREEALAARIDNRLNKEELAALSSTTPRYPGLMPDETKATRTARARAMLFSLFAANSPPASPAGSEDPSQESRDAK